MELKKENGELIKKYNHTLRPEKDLFLKKIVES
jgi:hypothetical protein